MQGCVFYNVVFTADSAHGNSRNVFFFKQVVDERHKDDGEKGQELRVYEDLEHRFTN